ncbi:UNVERIFIED_CONTAM: hypothetical protein FKN15_069649 [Acipenser sinensis]
MAAVVHFLMQRHLDLVEDRQEILRQRRPHIFKPRVTLFGMPEDVVVRRYHLTPQVMLDLIAEFHIFITWLTVLLVTPAALTFSTIEDHMALDSVTDVDHFNRKDSQLLRKLFFCFPCAKMTLLPFL